MFIKVKTYIILEVESHDQGEEACQALDTGLELALNNFPIGEIVQANVDTFKEMTPEEIKDLGL